MVIITVGIPKTSYDRMPLSRVTIRRNDMELVYKCSVKTGFFFAVCSFCWQRMDAQFIAVKLICDHIILHLDEKNPQDRIIMLAEFAPWNGELKREFASLLSKLIRLSERRPELAAIHTKLREVLEEGEFPEWELARKNFEGAPIEGAEITQFIKHIQKQGFVNPRILLRSQPRQLVQYMREFVLSDTVWRMVKKLSKQMGIGNSKMPQRVKSPNYRRHLKLPMPGRRIVQRIPPSGKTQILGGIDGVRARMEFPANAGANA